MEMDNEEVLQMETNIYADTSEQVKKQNTMTTIHPVTSLYTYIYIYMKKNVTNN